MFLLPSASILLFVLGIAGSASSAVVEVDPEVRSSVEEFLRSKSSLRVDEGRPLKMAAEKMAAKQQRKKEKHPRLEMVEEALAAIYHELYGAMQNVTELNAAEAVARSHMLSSPRQSFFANGLSQASEWVMSLVENTVEDIPSLPRLEAQECMKRSVCEAHNQPKKYGLIGLVLQLLFPPYSKAEDPSNVVSKYQLAARYGRQSNANCGVQYDGCMLNLLDIVQALVNAFIR